MASTETKPAEQAPAEQKPEQKTTALGEDDEFEDFPVDGEYRPHSPLIQAAARTSIQATFESLRCRWKKMDV